MQFWKNMIVKFFCSLLLISEFGFSKGEKTKCGFPGTPAYGQVKPNADLYFEGDVVFYQCRVGYILLGSPTSRCRDNGTWSEPAPICDDSMTTLGTAFSTPEVPGYPAVLAIDRNKTSCTYLVPRSTPRWWRINLGGEHNILSVAVTVGDLDKHMKFSIYIIKIEGTETNYKRCSSFTGKFNTLTTLFTCKEGKGIIGQQVHLEDHLKSGDLFEICEVEVRVQKDSGYDCGKPDRKPYSVTFDPQNKEVEYGCLTGYALHGLSSRICLNTGYWSGSPPTCEAIVCEELYPVKYGEMKISTLDGDIPLEGSIATYVCNEGYKLDGPSSRRCLSDGTWDERQPVCEAIRCPVPDGRELGGIYRLVNKTTRMGSMALLKCRKGKIEGENPYITCTEEGEWTDAQARCLLPASTSMSKENGPIIVNRGVLIFGMVMAGLMVTTVAVSFYVVKKRREAARPELPSRSLERPTAPPRPPPRYKGTPVPRRNVTPLPGPTDDAVATVASIWKAQSLPLVAKREKHQNASLSPSKSTDKELTVQEPMNKMVELLRGSAAETPEPETGKETDETQTANDQLQDTAGGGDVCAVTVDGNAGATETKKPAGEYAAVDYEKKRQSRLLKERDSSSRPTSPASDTSLPTSVPSESEDTAPEIPPKDNKKIKSEEKNEKTGIDSSEGTTEKSDVTPPEPTVSDATIDSTKAKATKGTDSKPSDLEKVPTSPASENKETKESVPASDDTGRRRRRRQDTTEEPSVPTTRIRTRDARR